VRKRFDYILIVQVQETIGNVTMVINNAGVVSGKSLINCSDASIQRTFDVNVIAHFWVS
jgi:all-trans-retinol dehydrogenase (NAD+)